MSDVKQTVEPGSWQNTGNPVLDSLVNILANYQFNSVPTMLESMGQIHAKLLELSVKEPGGLRRYRQMDGV